MTPRLKVVAASENEVRKLRQRALVYLGFPNQRLCFPKAFNASAVIIGVTSPVPPVSE